MFAEETRVVRDYVDYGTDALAQTSPDRSALSTNPGSLHVHDLLLR